jgi:non-specific serine/threonine protein kinase
MSHPFGDLLRQYRARKAGLSQTRLANLAGYDNAVLVRMSQGKKDLTGPSGRERVVRLIEVLADERAVTTLDEANALLTAANLSPLFERQPTEAKLMSRLAQTTSKPAKQARRGNLPASLAHFIGRAQETADVRQLLASTRLLTLTGSGGVGKTRLAQHVSADAVFDFADGAWYTELAPLSDGALVAEAVAPAFGLAVAEHSAKEQVIDYLRERQALLVLDNCEHLIDGVAAFTVGVLRACPQVTVLATSREALNVEGETAWRVPPMQPSEAARLFVERAHSARPDLSVDVDDGAVSHICQRLDGMPLAIELAAARLQGMSLTDLAARLDDRFALLTSGRRVALPRHQTLRATVDWSYDLLSEPERTLFCRLSVFVGGWTAELAEPVCADSPRLPDSPAPSLPSTDILPLLLQLVSKSLVVVEEREGETRYQFLETLREYALEKLAQHGELGVLQRWHAEAFADLAEQAHRPLRRSEQRLWKARLDRDYPNLHAALSWSFGLQGDPLIGCRIFGSLRVFWESGSHATDAHRWARLARNALTEQMPPGVRGGVWMVSTVLDLSMAPEEMLAGFRQALAYYTEACDQGGMADAMGNAGGTLLALNPHDPEGRRMLEESVSLARAAGDMLVEHCSLKGLGTNAAVLMEFDRAEALYRENIALCRQTGDLTNLAWVLCDFAHVYMERLQFQMALPYIQEALQVARQLNDYSRELLAQCLIAENTRYLGDIQHAVVLNEACLAFAREKLTLYDQLLPVLTLSKALNDAGESDRAEALLKEWVRTFYRAVGNKPYWYNHIAVTLACIAAGRGEATRAARLFGAADALFASTGERLWLHNVREIEPYIVKACTALGDAAYDAAYAEGRAMTPEQAVQFALELES